METNKQASRQTNSWCYKEREKKVLLAVYLEAETESAALVYYLRTAMVLVIKP